MRLQRSLLTNEGFVPTNQDRSIDLFETIQKVSNIMSTKASSSPPVDMSTKVGGRLFHPALPVVDGAFPNTTEQAFQKTLEVYVQENVPLEDVEGIQRRERVLDRMGALCREWIRSVCIQKGFPTDVVESSGGSLYTSGSYRLGEFRFIFTKQR